MSKCFVIVQGTGEWSDRDTTPARVYRSKDDAVAMMEKLDAEYRKVDVFWQKRHSEKGGYGRYEDAVTAANQIYQSLGFGCHGLDYYDWELCEVDLVE